jgi:hypothetical protein
MASASPDIVRHADSRHEPGHESRSLRFPDTIKCLETARHWKAREQTETQFQACHTPGITLRPVSDTGREFKLIGLGCVLGIDGVLGPSRVAQLRRDANSAPVE